jgi:uncharacterized repeat protein (TIGR01451 family)
MKHIAAKFGAWGLGLIGGLIGTLLLINIVVASPVNRPSAQNLPANRIAGPPPLALRLSSVQDVAPEAVTLDGPVSGQVGSSYIFTATVNPPTATLPITVTWQATDHSPAMHNSGLTDTVAFTWLTPGSKRITVTATNAAGSVTGMHTITIDSGGDVTPPIVTATDPTNGAIGVPRNAPIVVDFSEAMNTASVSTFITPAIGLMPGWSLGDTRLALTHSNLAASTRFTVTVSAGGDLAGNPLGNAPYTWVFTTTTSAAPEADLVLGKTRVGSGSVSAGERITYTLMITNSGPTTPVTATVVDTFNSAAPLAAVSGAGCAWTPGSAAITCTLSSIGIGNSASVILMVTTTETFSGTLINNASVSPIGGIIDPNPDNSSAGPVLVTVTKHYTVFLPTILK